MKKNHSLLFVIITTGMFLSLPVSSLAAEMATVDFSGVWMPTAIAPDGSRNSVYPETLPFRREVQEDYEAYLANYNLEVDDASRSCLPYGMPRQMVMLAQYPTEFIQTENRLTMVVELHNDVRRIYFDDRPTPQGLLPSWMGYSRGHWEGDALVVTTSNTREVGFPRPQSTELIIKEHFQLVDGGDAGEMIELTITLDDPLTFTHPLTVTTYFRQYDNLQMGEYFCSEDLWRQNLDGRSGYIPWR